MSQSFITWRELNTRPDELVLDYSASASDIDCCQKATNRDTWPLHTHVQPSCTEDLYNQQHSVDADGQD